MPPKTCKDTCEHCQPYGTAGWCVCWHKLIKGSRVQMGTMCTVLKVMDDIEYRRNHETADNETKNKP